MNDLQLSTFPLKEDQSEYFIIFKAFLSSLSSRFLQMRRSLSETHEDPAYYLRLQGACCLPGLRAQGQGAGYESK